MKRPRCFHRSREAGWCRLEIALNADPAFRCRIAAHTSGPRIDVCVNDLEAEIKARDRRPDRIRADAVLAEIGVAEAGIHRTREVHVGPRSEHAGPKSWSPVVGRAAGERPAASFARVGV